jgi:amino acid permease
MNDQFELYEHARLRQKQKKRLYVHFIIFLIGAVFLIFINKVLNVGEPFDWFVWAIVAWLFLLAIHFVNVFITHKFMGKEWERKQIEKLVAKQELKIEQLAKKVESEIDANNKPASNQ